MHKYKYFPIGFTISKTIYAKSTSGAWRQIEKTHSWFFEPKKVFHIKRIY